MHASNYGRDLVHFLTGHSKSGTIDIQKVYPRAPHHGHSAVSEGIPKGTPSWPFGRFTRYIVTEQQAADPPAVLNNYIKYKTFKGGIDL